MVSVLPQGSPPGPVRSGAAQQRYGLGAAGAAVAAVRAGHAAVPRGEKPWG